MTEENNTGNDDANQNNSKNQEAAMARITAQRDELKAKVEKFEASKNNEGFSQEDFKKQIIAEVKRDSAIDKFVKKNPDFGEFEETVRGLYEKGKVSADISADSVFYMAAGEKALELGANMKKKADDKANEEKTGGKTRSKGDSKGNDFSKMSEQDFNKNLQSVLASQ